MRIACVNAFGNRCRGIERAEHHSKLAKGATFKEITLDALRRTPVLQPPIPEQRAVSAFVARATAKLDSLIRHTERSISLLVERRAALITAAVTGQIDVRAEHTTEDLEPA